MRNLTPHFGRLAPTVFFAQGYSGRGMAAIGIAGLAIAGVIMGDDGRLRPFGQLRRSNIVTQPFLRKLGSYFGPKYYQWKDNH